MRKYRTAIVIILLPFITSCATIFEGRYDTFKFESSQEAKIYLNDKLIGTAPGTIKVRSEEVKHGSVLEIKEEGYETQNYVILRRVHTIYTVADILVAGVPFAIDCATGNIYRPFPRKFNVELTPIK